jgi:hypothetical protein
MHTPDQPTLPARQLSSPFVPRAMTENAGQTPVPKNLPPMTPVSGDTSSVIASPRDQIAIHSTAHSTPQSIEGLPRLRDSSIYVLPVNK